MAEVWTQWEGQLVNGRYPLRRFLNASDHSAVFLTESSTDGFLNAAIKLVPADPASTEAQLWQWKTAATFSHPHLVRLLESGSCEIQGRKLLFVVMEYAEENLSQVLPYRALEAGEVRELLVPTLDALAFLHRENWVQGQLRPSNLLVVNDQLKLAADTIRPIGLGLGAVMPAAPNDPPELLGGEVSSASDVWGLGLLLVEALTQYPPTWPDGPGSTPHLRADVPKEFGETIARCLSPNPADRPTIAQLQAWNRGGTWDVPKPAPSAAVATSPRPVVPPSPGPSRTGGASNPSPASVASSTRASTPPPNPAASTRSSAAPASIGSAAAATTLGQLPATPVAALAPSAVNSRPIEAPRAERAAAAEPRSSNFTDEPKRSLVGPAAAAVVVVLIAVWGGAKLFRGHRASDSSPQSAAMQSSPSTSTQSPANESMPTASSAVPATTTPTAKPQQPTPNKSQPPSAAKPQQPLVADVVSGVVHEELPKPSAGARNTIRGHIKVAVRVSVDRSGNVVRDRFESAGPSNYFNRLASQAARKWKFSAAPDEASREWVLRFEYGREGTTARAVRARS